MMLDVVCLILSHHWRNSIEKNITKENQLICSGNNKLYKVVIMRMSDDSEQRRDD